MRPFEAIIFRYMPDEGSGEALNVGLAMRLRDGTFFDAAWIESWRRVTDAFPATHTPTVRHAVMGIQERLESTFTPDQAQLDSGGLEAELHRIAPSPDGAIQWTTAIEGVTGDPAKTFARLKQRYLEQHEKDRGPRPSRTDDEVERSFLSALERRGNLQLRLSPRTLQGVKRRQFEVRVEHCWKNGRWNCVQPVSFDLLQPREIQNKAAAWIGNVRVISPSEQDTKLVLFVGLPPESRAAAHAAAIDAMAALREEVDAEAEVIDESCAEALAARVEADLTHHPAV